MGVFEFLSLLTSKGLLSNKKPLRNRVLNRRPGNFLSLISSYVRENDDDDQHINEKGFLDNNAVVYEPVLRVEI